MIVKNISDRLIRAGWIPGSTLKPGESVRVARSFEELMNDKVFLILTGLVYEVDKKDLRTPSNGKVLYKTYTWGTVIYADGPYGYRPYTTYRAVDYSKVRNGRRLAFAPDGVDLFLYSTALADMIPQTDCSTGEVTGYLVDGKPDPDYRPDTVIPPTGDDKVEEPDNTVVTETGETIVFDQESVTETVEKIEDKEVDKTQVVDNKEVTEVKDDNEPEVEDAGKEVVEKTQVYDDEEITEVKDKEVVEYEAPEPAVEETDKVVEIKSEEETQVSDDKEVKEPKQTKRSKRGRKKTSDKEETNNQ